MFKYQATVCYLNSIFALKIRIMKQRSVRRLISLIIILFSFTQTALAQVEAYTEADTKLDSAVHMYNRMRDGIDNLSKDKVTNEILENTRVQRNAIVTLLDEVIVIGNAQNISTAKYFRTLAHYEYGYLLGVAAKMNDARFALEVIKSDMLSMQPSDFKKTYKFEGKNYSIAWENIAPTLIEYFTSMSELYYSASNYSESIKMAMLSMNFEYTTESLGSKYWYKYIAATNYLISSSALKTYNAEAAQVAYNQINYYYQMGKDNQELVTNNGLLGYATGYNFIIGLEQNNKSVVSDGVIYAQTATLLKTLNDNTRAATMYTNALNNGYYNASWIEEVYLIANAEKNNALGLLATEKEAARVSSSDCPAWREIASKYAQYGNSIKSNQANTTASNCEATAKAAQDAYEKQQAKQQRKDNLDFSIYAGVYPLPLIIRYNKYRDYGAVAGIGLYDVTIEASYKLINLNHVIYEDLTYQDVDYDGYENYWDGYRAHIALKFGDRDPYSEGAFYGPLFEVVSRNYLRTTSNVFSADGITYLYETDFTPSELSYNLMLNMGARIEENFVMLEMFMGLGASYNQFDGGGIEYDNDAFFLDNPVLQNRKPTRFGPIIRMGMTVGLTTRNN